MKHILVVVCVVLTLLTVQPAFAGNDICILASQVVDMAPEKFDDFYKQNIDRRLLTGRGKILKLKQTGGQGANENIQARISCSEKVIIIIRTNEFGVLKAKAKVGDVVSFTGECTKMYKSYGIVYGHMRATTR